MDGAAAAARSAIQPPPEHPRVRVRLHSNKKLYADQPYDIDSPSFCKFTAARLHRLLEDLAVLEQVQRKYPILRWEDEDCWQIYSVTNSYHNQIAATRLNLAAAGEQRWRRGCTTAGVCRLSALWKSVVPEALAHLVSRKGAHAGGGPGDEAEEGRRVRFCDEPSLWVDSPRADAPRHMAATCEPSFAGERFKACKRTSCGWVVKQTGFVSTPSDDAGHGGNESENMMADAEGSFSSEERSSSSPFYTTVAPLERHDEGEHQARGGIFLLSLPHHKVKGIGS